MRRFDETPRGTDPVNVTSDAPLGAGADRTTRFWDRIARRYARKPVPDEAVYQRKLEITRRYLRPDSEVLELGCGTGSTAIAHAPYVKHIRAIDFSAGMLEIAGRKAAAGGVWNVTFERADVSTVRATDGTVDAVLALSVLHLLEDRDAVIGEVHRMLAPGGVFVTSTACIGDTMGWFRLIAPAGRWLGLIPLVRVFTAGELRESLRAAGFELQQEWQPGKGKAVFIVARKAAER